MTAYQSYPRTERSSLVVLLNKIVILCSVFCVLVLSGCGTLNTQPGNTNSKKITGNFYGCSFGSFVGTVDAVTLNSYESTIDRSLPVVHWYVNWTQGFPSSECELLRARGSIPYITWEPWRGIIVDPVYSLDNIIAGTFDIYMRTWAADCKNYGNPLFLRFAHEMNGSWYPWDGYHNGSSESSSSKYILAWKHVYNIFSSLGVDNVTWVWSPNNNSVPNSSWNSISNYYPGDDYVDWIAIDGYNFGTDGSRWETFDELFLSTYTLLSGAYQTKPFMIGEFACSENGGSKADWITDSFSKIKNSYANIKLVSWFNISKEADWRIDSSNASKTSFTAEVNSSYFLGTIGQ